MAVHVGDLFADIRQAEPGRTSGSGDAGDGGGRTAAELWDEARDRATWLAARTAAADFED